MAAAAKVALYKTHTMEAYKITGAALAAPEKYINIYPYGDFIVRLENDIKNS